MKRRLILSTAAAGGAATLASAAFAQTQAPATVRWRMPSSFPKSLTTVFGGAQSIASIVSNLTDGKFTITPFGAGEMVPALAVLDAVQANTVECGHTAGFYYIGKEPALAFDTGMPFGMGPRQHDAWMLYGGGQDLMNEVYQRFNVVQIPCGNTGAQMGGWFRKEIRSPEDFKGLRIRAAGFLGQIYAKLGAIPQQLPASDIYPALEKGVIDAVEWVGPFDDEKLGLNKVAKYYYAPGVLERGASLCFIVNKTAWASLPPSYQAALKAACAQTATDMLAKYDTNNVPALKRMIGSGTKLGYWSRPIMEAMQKAAATIMQEQSANSEAFRKIYTPWKAFLDEQVLWSSINDGAAEQFLAGGQRKRL